MSHKEELPRVTGGQQLLFSRSARLLARELGINWWAVVKFYEDGLLSYNPEETFKLDEGQEAELSFLAALITSDCTPYVLDELLECLPKPFRYRHSEIYYDWSARRWRPLPLATEPEASFADWLEDLIEHGDRDALELLRDQVDDALQRIGNSKVN